MEVWCKGRSTSAADIWCVLQLVMTLLYVETHVWTSACVVKPTLGRPAVDDDFIKLLYSLQNYVIQLKKT